jgi:uncharacterized protein (TIGR03067 family)
MSTLATALLVMVVVQSPDEAAKAEMKKMEGTWRIVSAISDGKPQPDDRLKAITIAIKADGTWVENDGKETFESTFTVDPAKSPKTANFVNKSGNMKGITCLEIYEIDGDTMKMCFVSVPTGKESTKERPSKFASEAGSGHYLCVMKREKYPPDLEKNRPGAGRGVQPPRHRGVSEDLLRISGFSRTPIRRWGLAWSPCERPTAKYSPRTPN